VTPRRPVCREQPVCSDMDRVESDSDALTPLVEAVGERPTGSLRFRWVECPWDGSSEHIFGARPTGSGPVPFRRRGDDDDISTHNCPRPI
jgi:hypothetical protein